MEQDRFEVELTPVERGRTRHHRRHRAPPPVPTPLDASRSSSDDAHDGTVVTSPRPDANQHPQGGWLSSDRARLATTAAVTAVVAVLLGWVLGRASVGPPDEARAIVSTIPEVTAPTPASTVLAGDPIPPVRTARPARTTTTSTLPAIEIGTIGIDERIVGTPIELVAWRNVRRIVEVDLATGTTRTIPIDVGNVEADHVRVGPDWVLIPSYSHPSWIAYGDGTVEHAGIGDMWSTQWVPGTDRFWRLTQVGSEAGHWTFSEVLIDGSFTGAKIEVPRQGTPYWFDGWVPDPAGGVVTNIAGGAYAVGVDGAEFLGHGDVVAVDTDLALLRRCGERLECGHVVVDRTTGSTRDVVPVDADGEPVELRTLAYTGRYRPMEWTPVSPDGRWMVVAMLVGYAERLGVLDLDTGRVIELAWRGSTGSGVVFSTDGRYAFYLDGHDLHALEFATGDRFPVFTERVSWQAFGLRDARAAPAADPPTSGPTSGASGASSG